MKLQPPPKAALLACSVFEREIALLMRGAEHIAETRFFEMGLHDRTDVLRATLQQQLDEADARKDIEAIVLAYGLCGRGTAGLRTLRHELAIPRAHDCITVFMGSKEAYAEHQHRCPTCYYYTPGWNRNRHLPPTRHGRRRAGSELRAALRRMAGLEFRAHPRRCDLAARSALGNWDNERFQKPDDMYREVRERIDIFIKDGGFVCNAVHNIQGNSPIENVLAMLGAIKDSAKS